MARAERGKMDEEADVIRWESVATTPLPLNREVGLIGCMAKLPLIAYAGKL